MGGYFFKPRVLSRKEAIEEKNKRVVFWQEYISWREYQHCIALINQLNERLVGNPNGKTYKLYTSPCLSDVGKACLKHELALKQWNIEGITVDEDGDCVIHITN